MQSGAARCAGPRGFPQTPRSCAHDRAQFPKSDGPKLRLSDGEVRQQMGDHTGLRHQSPTGTSRRALGRTSANPIQTRVIGPGPHPGRCKPLLPVTLNSTPTTTHSQATQFLATPLPPISRCPPFHSPVLPNRRRHRTSLLFLATRTASATVLARLGLDSPASDFSSQLVPSAVYLRFTSHPKWQTFFYVGATRTSLMARDHSRFRKLLQVQRHHLVNAELAVPLLNAFPRFRLLHFSAHPHCRPSNRPLRH